MAGEKGSVICEVSEQTRASAIRGNKNPRLLHEYGISVLQGATNCLNIYDRNCKRNGTIKLPGACLCFDIVSSQGFCVLLCGLEDGRIISVSLQQWCIQAKKKKKKNKSKEKKGVHEDQAFEGQEEEQRKLVKQNLEGGDGDVGHGRVDGGGGEEDIFADLLAGEEDDDDLMMGCGGGDSELFANQMREFYAALGEVKVIDKPHVVLETQNLEGFLVTSNTLVTCCREDHGWRISAHQCSEDPTKVSSITCEKTPSYSTIVFSCDELPDIGSFDFKSHFAARSHNLFGKAAQCQHDALGNVALDENTDKENKANQTALLYGVISMSSSHGNQTALLQSTSILVISDTLFDSLWGAAANLIDCPVVLVILPDGYVYAILLKNVSIASGMSQRGQHRVRLLYQSVQPIIQVSSIALSQSEPVRTSSDCLVLVGASGQIVTLVAETTEPQATRTVVHNVHGPLATAVVVKNKLACAANSEINLVAFHLDHDGAVQIEVQRFQVAGIFSLACVKANSSCLKFLAVKKDGTLLRLTLPTDETPSMNQSSMTSSAAGQRIKELLHSIQEISSKMASLTEVAKGQTLILQELGKAHHVVCNVAEWLRADAKELGKSACPSNEKSGAFHHRTKATEQPDAFELRVRAECCFHNGGSQVKVVCEVTNGTPWTLSRGWTLVASLSGNIDQDMDSRCCPYHKTVGIPLVNFVPQATELFSFVLNEGSQRFVFPLEVQCSLHFDFPSFREHHLGSGNDHFSHETDVMVHDCCQGVMFTVGSRTLDILDALQFPSIASQRYMRQRKPHSARRTSGFSGRSEVQTTSRKQSSFGFDCSSSISISVDKALLRTLPKDDKLDLSEKLIYLLMPSNRLREFKGHCIEAATPDGCLVSIQAVDSPVTQTVTLQITASEDRVTRRLAQAIHHRLKSASLVLAPLSLDAEEGQKDMRDIKNQSESLHAIQDQLATQPSKVHLLDIAKGVMGIHSNMRSQLAIH